MEPLVLLNKGQFVLFLFDMGLMTLHTCGLPYGRMGVQTTKELGAGSRGGNLRSREQRKKYWEQAAEENNQGATQRFLREQGNSKNNLGSIAKLIWGAPRKQFREPGDHG